MIYNYPTLTDLWHKSVWKMWRGQLGEGEDLDFVASIDTIAYDNLLSCDSMAYEFDLGRDLWLNKQRWTRLVRQYLDPGETARFLSRAADLGLGEGKRGAVTSMFCANVNREAKKHRWGNCMAVFTYRGVRNREPTLTLHSRVSYIAYIGGLDLALAHVLARYIGKRIKVPVEEFKFVWHVDALQFHGFKSLPLLYKQRYIEDLDGSNDLRAQYPTIKLVGRWWDAILRNEEEGKTLEEEKYGPLRRIRRRYQEWERGEFLPSVYASDLDLTPLTRR